MEFKDAVSRLRQASWRLFELLRRCEREDEVLAALWEILGGRREVSFRGRLAPGMRVDLVLEDIAVEVEFNKQPYEGLQQVIAYRALLGFDKALLIHVVSCADEGFVEALRKMLSLIGDEGIRGIVISIEDGEIIEL